MCNICKIPCTSLYFLFAQATPAANFNILNEMYSTINRVFL